jgi:hypothetical protein
VGGERPSRLPEAVLRGRVEPLALDADPGAEERQPADPVEVRDRRGDGGPELQDQARRYAELGEQGQGTAGRRVLGVDAHQVGAGAHELPDLRLEDDVRHHEVDVERTGGEPADGRHQVGEEQEVGREVPIRDVEVVGIGEGLRAGHLLRQATEVGGPERELGEEALAGKRVDPARVGSHGASSPRKRASAARNSSR